MYLRDPHGPSSRSSLLILLSRLLPGGQRILALALRRLWLLLFRQTSRQQAPVSISEYLAYIRVSIM